MSDPDWPSGTPEWDERDDGFEVHEASCDPLVGCTCGAREEELAEAILAHIHEPGDHRSLLISFWSFPSEAFIAHADFGPLEI